MSQFTQPCAAGVSGFVVAVVGASGAVGVELVRCLEQRHFPVSELKLFASARSAGNTLSFRGRSLRIEELDEQSFRGVDLALFSAGSAISKRYAPLAARQGTLVIDNSSAFRMDPTVPLVIPSVRPVGPLVSSTVSSTELAPV